jgi:ribosomal protein L11 methylase PrmA
LKGHTQDPRMSLIPSSLITDKNVLDIGCNSGNFSILLGKNSMLVLDIVGTLSY